MASKFTITDCTMRKCQRAASETSPLKKGGDTNAQLTGRQSSPPLPATEADPTAMSFLDQCIGILARIDCGANYQFALADRLDGNEEEGDVPLDILKCQIRLHWRQLREDVCAMLRQQYLARQQWQELFPSGSAASEFPSEQDAQATEKLRFALFRTSPLRVLTLLSKLQLFNRGRLDESEDLSSRFREIEYADLCLSAEKRGGSPTRSAQGLRAANNTNKAPKSPTTGGKSRSPAGFPVASMVSPIKV